MPIVGTFDFGQPALNRCAPKKCKKNYAFDKKNVVFTGRPQESITLSRNLHILVPFLTASNQPNSSDEKYMADEDERPVRSDQLNI